MEPADKLIELLARQRAIASELRLIKDDFYEENAVYSNVEQAEDAADESADLINAALELLEDA